MGFSGPGSTVKRAMIAQIAIILANYVFTFLSLTMQKPSSEQLRSCSEDASKSKIKSSASHAVAVTAAAQTETIK